MENLINFYKAIAEENKKNSLAIEIRENFRKNLKKAIEKNIDNPKYDNE